MAKASTRREYLANSLPSEYNEYATGLRSLPFISTRGAFGSLTGSQSPTLISSIFDQKSKFESKTVSPGSSFERFLNLQRDPNSLIAEKMKVPAGFTQAINMASGFGS